MNYMKLYLSALALNILVIVVIANSQISPLKSERHTRLHGWCVSEKHI